MPVLGELLREGLLGTSQIGHLMTPELPECSSDHKETGGKAGQNLSTEVLWVQGGT